MTIDFSHTYAVIMAGGYKAKICKVDLPSPSSLEPVAGGQTQPGQE